MINWKGIIFGVILSLILVFGGGVLWIEFVQRIAPHLNRNEAGSAAVLGMIAILCFSVYVALVVWTVKTQGHFSVSVIFKKRPVSTNEGIR